VSAPDVSNERTAFAGRIWKSAQLVAEIEQLIQRICFGASGNWRAEVKTGEGDGVCPRVKSRATDRAAVFYEPTGTPKERAQHPHGMKWPGNAIDGTPEPMSSAAGCLFTAACRSGRFFAVPDWPSKAGGRPTEPESRSISQVALPRAPCAVWSSTDGKPNMAKRLEWHEGLRSGESGRRRGRGIVVASPTNHRGIGPSMRASTVRNGEGYPRGLTGSARSAESISVIA
jgi:hypothetical protein